MKAPKMSLYSIISSLGILKAVYYFSFIPGLFWYIVEGNESDESVLVMVMPSLYIELTAPPNCPKWQ